MSGFKIVMTGEDDAADMSSMQFFITEQDGRACFLARRVHDTAYGRALRD